MIDGTSRHLMFLCDKLGILPSVGATSISWVVGGVAVAGAVFDSFTGKSITAHIWVKERTAVSKLWFAAICDYPFNQLGVTKVIGKVDSNNLRAIHIDEHMGFELEAVIGDYSDEGDMLLYTMVKSQCRMLNSPLWARVIRRVA